MSSHAKQTAVKLFESIDRSQVSDTWFITCTLPADENMAVDEFKKVLARYFARLQRAWGDRLAWYWAIEPSAAGTWHLHMIAMWVRGPSPLWKKFVAWNDLAWSSSTRCKHPSHQRSACNVDRARSWAGVVVYLSGYLSPKKWEHYDGPDTGRVHGVRNAQLLPIVPEKVELTKTALTILRRAVAKIIGRRRAGTWLVDLETGKRRRQPGCDYVDANLARRMRKTWSRVSMGAEYRAQVKIIRTRGRAHWRVPEWEDEFSVTIDPRSGGVVETFIRQRPKEEDEWGRPVATLCIGPSVLRIPFEQSRRLLTWAVAEARRLDAFDQRCPF